MNKKVEFKLFIKFIVQNGFSFWINSNQNEFNIATTFILNNLPFWN